MSINEFEMIAAFFAGAGYLVFGQMLWIIIDARLPEVLGKYSERFWTCALVIITWPASVPLALLVWLLRGRPGRKDSAFFEWLRF